MSPALQENARGLRRSRRQPAELATAAEKSSKSKKQAKESEPESEVDELSDTEDSNSDDGDDSFHVENSKPTTIEKQRRKRATNSNSRDSPPTLLQGLDEDDDNYDLYAQLLRHTSPIDSIIEEWIEKYKGPEKMDAVQDLINFIIRTCGTKEKIDPKAIEDDDFIIEALQNLEKKLSSDRYTEYPIASKLRVCKTLKADLITFWKKLIEECQYDIIYDGLLVETLQAWLATMSSIDHNLFSSTFRPFRHTATVVALNLISALSTVANRAVQEKQITNRQLGAERRKNSKGNASERQKMLEEKSKALTNKERRLNGYLKHYFDSIFVHRCRDIEAVIRVECIKQLGDWMELYPSYFLDNQYLRYIGWLLNDKSTSVRTESIKAIISLYDYEANATKMTPFMQRFKTRLVEMAIFEADQTTRVQAIGLCVSLAENSLLDIADSTDLGALIYSDLPKIRTAIAPLIHLSFVNSFVTPKMDEVKTKAATLPAAGATGGRTRAVAQDRDIDKNAIQFKCLANLLLEYSRASQTVKKPKSRNETDDSESNADNEMELDFESDIAQTSTDKLSVDPRFGNAPIREQSRITQAITSLFHELPILQEWKALVDFLLKDYSTSKSSNSKSTRTGLEQYYQLTDDQENALIETLVTVVSISIDQSAERKQKSRKKTTAEADTKNQISQHFAQALPRLMSKYAADAHKIAQILVLPQLINLSAYTDLRMPKSYEQLLEDVKKVFLRHTTSQVHLNGALTIKRLTSFESMASATEAGMIEFRDELSTLFKRSFADKNLQAKDLPENELHTLIIALSRYQRIIEVMDITEMFEEKFSDDIMNAHVVLQILERGKLGNEEESVMVISAATILFQYLAWKSYQTLGDNANDSVGEDLSSFITLRNNVLHTLTDLSLNNESFQPVDSIRHTAFQLFVDLHWLFSNEQFRRLHDSEGSSLMVRCAPNLQANAAEYVEKELDKWALAYNADEEADEQDADLEIRDEIRPSSTVLSDPKRQYELLAPIAAFTKAIMLGIFDTHLATPIIKRYRTLGPELDEAIKAMIFSIKDGLNTAPNTKLAGDIVSMYMNSLKESFIYHTREQHLKLDKPLQLARLLAGSIKAADSDPFHKTSPDLLTDKLHIAGITYCVSKAGGYNQINKSESKATCLKFFKILSIFSPLLTRARDVAKIHRHTESLLEEHGFSGELDGKDWDAYNAYVASIDTVLQKKGLRYDTSSKNNANTNQRHLANVDQNRPEEIGRLQANVTDNLAESDDEPLERATKQTDKKSASGKSKRGTKRKAEPSSKLDAKQIRLSDMLEKL